MAGEVSFSVFVAVYSFPVVRFLAVVSHPVPTVRI